MTALPDAFRNLGLVPQGAAPSRDTIRAYLPLGSVIGQYLFTCLMSGLGIGGALFLVSRGNSPLNLLAALALLAGVVYVVFSAVRNDWSWVELTGERIRARHLYTGRVIERGVDEIVELQTFVYKVRTVAIQISEARLGRVRGIEIRLRDKRTPIRVFRADPAFKNARELIEAVIWRMSELGEIDVEIIDLDGSPLIKRVYWKQAA